MIGRLSPRRRRAAQPPDGAEPSAPPPEAETTPLAPIPVDRLRPVQAPLPAAAPVSAAELAPPLPLASGADVVLPESDPALPAGLELQPAADPGPVVPSFRNRGRLRRRLQFLRRARELGFRDLGGLVFDLHRFGREGQGLVQTKLDALSAVDAELRTLERLLDDGRDYVELREPGIAACPRCAALHGSDAHFCPGCGLHLSGPMALAEVSDAPAGAPPLPLGGALPPYPGAILAPMPAVTTPPGPGAAVPPNPGATAAAAPAWSVRPSPGATAPPAPAATTPPSPGATAAPAPAAATPPGPGPTAPPAPAGSVRSAEDGVRAADAGQAPVSSGLGPLAPSPSPDRTTVQPAVAPPPAGPATPDEPPRSA